MKAGIKSLNPEWLLLIILLTFFGPGLSGQRLKPGPQDLSFFSKADDTDQPYAVYIPKNFDESRQYPLVIFLHGAMSNHRLGLRRAFGQGNIQGEDFIKPGNIPAESDLEVTRFFPGLKDVDYIVAAPYARGTAGYQGIPEQDVYDMLADLQGRFPIDENRIYLTGLSMGGGGTLWLGLTRPDIWAAIAPCCPAPPDGTTDLSSNAINIPVHLFIGDKDFLYQTALDWKKRFEANGSRFDYVEYPGIGHNSWEYAYKNGFIFDWFSQFRRDLFPARVSFNTRWYKYNKAYWVNIDKITPGTLATIDAKFTNDNIIEISTKAIDAFTLKLAGHPKFRAGSMLSVKIDGNVISVKTPDAASFRKENEAWKNGKYTPGLYSKKQGAEGPLTAAFSANHIYVYGTGGSPTAEELQSRRAVASSAADWATDRGMMGRVMIFPRVLSDRELRPSDFVNSNLVLFGTRETNSIIEKFADRLPVHLNNDRKDFGLTYIFPLNNHYVVVNSGLPWWTPVIPKKDQQPAMRFAFLGNKSEELGNYEDFVLFRNTPDDIVSKGYFDNDWKIPVQEIIKMKASGAVKIKE